MSEHDHIVECNGGTFYFSMVEGQSEAVAEDILAWIAAGFPRVVTVYRDAAGVEYRIPAADVVASAVLLLRMRDDHSATWEAAERDAANALP